MNSQIGLSRKPVQRPFQLQPCTGQLLLGKILAYPEGWAPHKQPYPTGIGNLEAIPTRKGFFFEQAKVSGIMGNPVAFAR